jgi:hypothetical protein
MVGIVVAAASAAVAQESAIVAVPAVIKAGEELSFTITLDKAPSVDGGHVELTLTGPDVAFSFSSDAVKAGQTECSASLQIPAAATGGTWRVHINGFYTGTKILPLGSADADFEVLANKNLVFPSSAEVRIKLSQVQLLRTAAIQLQAQVQNFKAALAPYSEYTEDGNRSVVKIVRQNISDAIKSLDATQSSFRALAGDEPQPAVEQVFFDDLRASYRTVLAEVDQGHVLSREIVAVTPVGLRDAAQANKPEAASAILAQAALRPFEQNELAYTLVADTQSLTFDLTVASEPSGASVCYHRRGDPCRPNPENTNTVINSLTLAVWLVQFQKAGYMTEEREHDPFREPNHEINVELRPLEKPPERP